MPAHNVVKSYRGVFIVKDLVVQPMEYDAITFDTQTVERSGYHFDSGMLAQLKQFKDGPTDVIISELVLRELRKHLIVKTQSAKDALISASGKAAEYGLISTPQPAFSTEPVNVKEAATQRLSGFLKAIGANGLKVDNVTTRNLIDLYFTPAPPFSASGNKKNEFPDAIALLSLEAWAKKEGKKILACSADVDWLNYGEKSEHIDVVDKLEDALAKLQEHIDESNLIAGKILKELLSNKDSEMMKDIVGFVEQEVSGISVYGEADSAYHAEPVQTDLTLLEFSLIGTADDIDFTVVQAGPEIIVLSVDANLKVHADGSFSLSMYDSIDKDYVPMGSTDASIEDDIEVSLLLTFVGNIQDNELTLTETEIVEAPSSIDFGYIEPDFGAEYYE